MKIDLQQKLLNLESFKRQIKFVLLESVRDSLNKNIKYEKINYKKEIDWNNLLSIASILNQSEDFECLDYSLRIAQHCLLSKHSNETQKIASAIILEGLTNKLAIELAIKRNLLDEEYQKYIPLPLQLDRVSRDISNSIIDSNDKLIPLNKFQKKVYDSRIGFDLVSISAPTSAGKSFILMQIVMENITLSKKNKNIVFLVPTRSLINQVEDDFRMYLLENKIKDIYISSVPEKIDEEYLKKSKILIFTQERLHYFRNANKNLKIDIVIVDEAQKIEDKSRGVFLQQKIEDLIYDFPKIKIFFSSPFTSNPEKLFEINNVFKKNRETVKTNFVAVNQNLIFLSNKNKSNNIFNIELCTKQGNVEIGSFEIKNNIKNTNKNNLITEIVKVISDKNGGNIIYVNTPSDAEKIANLLYNKIRFTQISDSIKDLQDLIDESIHKKYLLRKVLKKRIAFHYGSMPLIIRKEIENLFKNGEIDFLVCTSTLLEGVNLPTKNIFIYKPKRGQSNPMSDSDFWNLAGRAGRWGKEFQGNIICISPDDWENPPSIDRKKSKINLGVDLIYENYQDMISFIGENSPRKKASSRQDLETGFSYLYSNYLTNRLYTKNNKYELDNKILSEIFKSISKEIEIPKEILLKNLGISPIAQQDLLNYFKYNGIDPYTMILKKPNNINDSIDKNIVEIYNNVIQIINKYLSGDSEKLSYYQSILVLHWMTGKPISILIERSISYWKNHNKNKDINTVIRDTMSDIEEFARFKFAKYSSCYIDILKFYIQQKKINIKTEQLEHLDLFLEFGASEKTQISFMSLGLSRTSAISISKKIENKNMSRKECLNWLKNNKIKDFKLSNIIIKEVEKILSII